jgi:hypothetical protein
MFKVPEKMLWFLLALILSLSIILIGCAGNQNNTPAVTGTPTLRWTLLSGQELLQIKV